MFRFVGVVINCPVRKPNESANLMGLTRTQLTQIFLQFLSEELGCQPNPLYLSASPKMAFETELNGLLKRACIQITSVASLFSNFSFHEYKALNWNTRIKRSVYYKLLNILKRLTFLGNLIQIGNNGWKIKRIESFVYFLNEWIFMWTELINFLIRITLYATIYCKYL